MDASGMSGTLTFLFTDIESSTSMWERFPVAMASALACHDELLHEVVAEHRGTVFHSGGDGFGVVFPSAEDGVEAAVALQRRLSQEHWATPVPIRVRAGLHSGVAEMRKGNYFGTAVNRAARVSAQARGGQLLVSTATGALVSNGPWVLVDVGLHDLKGLDRAERLFEIRPEAQRGPASPIIMSPALVGTVPRRQPGLIGRDDEIRLLAGLVLPGNVVTLRGPGGVGKTRLALAACHELREQFADGAWFVDLSGTSDAGTVCAATSTALGLFVPQAYPAPLDIASALGSQQRLILLDNCEHVGEVVAALVEALTTRCPRVGVVATSRERLGHQLEQVVAVQPLRTERGGSGPSTAGRLLLDRVTGRVPEYLANTDDLEGIEEICQLVDGMPLAIELAAAQVGTLGVAHVRRRLERAVTLSDPLQRGTDRHRSLRDSIEWSHGLLRDDERLLFDILSVFPLSFDLDAAEAVGSSCDGTDIAGLLTSLVEKSLVSVTRIDGLVRCRLLAMSREFGRERLSARGLADAVADLHAQYFRTWCVRADQGVRGPEEMRWHLGFTHDWNNVSTAFQHSLVRRDGDAVCEILWRVGWWAQTRLRMEVAGWAEAARSLPEARSSPYFAMALAVAAAFAKLRSDMPLADRLLQEAEAFEREHGPSPQPWVSWERVRYLRILGTPNAEAVLAALAAQVGDDPVWSVMLDFPRYQLEVVRCAWPETGASVDDELRRAVERALRRAEALGAPSFLSRAHGLVALAERAVALTRALERFEHATALAQDAGNFSFARENSIDAVQLRGATGRPREALLTATGLIEDYVRSNAAEPAAHIALACFPALVALEEHQAAATIAHALRSNRAASPVWVEYLVPAHLIQQLERAAGPIADLAVTVRGRGELLDIVRRQLADALTRAEGP